MAEAKIALESGTRAKPMMKAAITSGGGKLVDFKDAEGLIFVRPFKPDILKEILTNAPKLKWIQLPYAGIEPFVNLLDPKYIWTCGKGIYARPVAEMALAMLLAGFRRLNTYIPAKTWEPPVGENLIGANILILGGGGICEELVKLILPFDCNIKIVRRHPVPINIDAQVEIFTPDNLPKLYEAADAVVLTLSLTPETENIINAAALQAMKSNCWVINVARGKHIDTEALVAALESESIGGAGLDVTEPEPLPDNHPLWQLDNCIITPHTANTPEMGVELLKGRIQENVQRFCQGKDLLGLVNVELGY